jgi:hypothetical protein
MGLDMYLHSTPEPIDSDTDFEGPAEEYFHSWRKHPKLHGWMEKLYLEKGGKDHEFNLCNLKLTKLDLLRLRQDILTDNLPETAGFFFGRSRGDSEESSRDLVAIEKSLEKIEQGLNIYYYASY